MTDKEKRKLAEAYTNDKEQDKWENKELGNDPKHAKKSKILLKRSGPISIRIPPDVLEDLKDIAEVEGYKYQTYIVALLKRHVKEKRSA